MAPHPSHRSALLCPGCRRIVSADEHRCPHCGLLRPGSRWQQWLGAGLLVDGRRLLTAIVAANLAMYLLSLLLASRGVQLSTNPLSLLAPDHRALFALGATGTWPIGQGQRWWTLISASYLHGGLVHLGFNMLAIRQIAPLIMETFGPARMLVIYTLGGAAGFLLSYLAGVPLTIGASASLCALIGAAIYYGRHRGGVFGQAVYRQVGGWALGILVFGFIVPGINNWAHGGGMLAGMGLGAWLGYRERRQQLPGERWIGAVCLVGTTIVLFWAILNGLFQA